MINSSNTYFKYISTCFYFNIKSDANINNNTINKNKEDKKEQIKETKNIKNKRSKSYDKKDYKIIEIESNIVPINIKNFYYYHKEIDIYI